MQLMHVTAKYNRITIVLETDKPDFAQDFIFVLWRPSKRNLMDVVGSVRSRGMSEEETLSLTVFNKEFQANDLCVLRQTAIELGKEEHGAMTSDKQVIRARLVGIETMRVRKIFLEKYGDALVSDDSESREALLCNDVLRAYRVYTTNSQEHLLLPCVLRSILKYQRPHIVVDLRQRSDIWGANRNVFRRIPLSMEDFDQMWSMFTRIVVLKFCE